MLAAGRSPGRGIVLAGADCWADTAKTAITMTSKPRATRIIGPSGESLHRIHDDGDDGAPAAAWSTALIPRRQRLRNRMAQSSSRRLKLVRHHQDLRFAVRFADDLKP